MSYKINEKKSYTAGPDALYQAALAAVAGLEGKVEEEDAAAHTLQAKFDKKIHGQVLGDRTRLHVQIGDNNGESQIAIEAYPIDPVGRELKFGARKGVTAKVVNWFFAHLEHQVTNT